MTSPSTFVAMCALLALGLWSGVQGAEGRPLHTDGALSCAQICYFGRDADDSTPHWREFWSLRGLDFSGQQSQCESSCSPVNVASAIQFGAVTCAQYCSDERANTRDRVFCRAATQWDDVCPQAECQATCLTYFQTGSILK